jgi:predicted DCC family thiol-disulfide oxidoreductase YuxK
MQAMQLVLPDNTVLSGEKALPEILKRLRRYGPVATLFKLPGSEILSRVFYRWFADRRYHIARLLFPKKGKNNRDDE